MKSSARPQAWAPSRWCKMMQLEGSFPVPLPDDPYKWDGWSKYKSPNLYERLCLDPRANPSNELIEQHCRELMRWWQKKLPLKNQPSNPLAQLLRSGLEESSRFLTEARVELLDPERRRVLDNELAAQAQEEAVTEFHKFLAFALADGTLSPETEKNLLQFGAEHGLTNEQMLGYIELELQDSGAKRVESVVVAAPPSSTPRSRRRGSLDPKEDFMRMLRLSALDSDSMTDDQRDAFINMAENLGLEADNAEDLVDLYLEEADKMSNPDMPEPVAPVAKQKEPVTTSAPPPSPDSVAENPQIQINETAERAQFINFQNSVGGQMLFVPSGEFSMGSDAVDAAPNERPITRVTLSRFYLSRHLITNADFEQFDPTHARKRAPGAGDRHPVVYISSLEDD